MMFNAALNICVRFKLYLILHQSKTKTCVAWVLVAKTKCGTGVSVISLIYIEKILERKGRVHVEIEKTRTFILKYFVLSSHSYINYTINST